MANSSSNSKQVLTDMHSLNQHEFETAIYRILEYGDISDLAHAVGKSAGYYSQMFNPEDPRESVWYRAALDFHNLIAIDPERGKAALDLFNYFAKRSLPGNGSLCVDRTRERAWKESTEAALAEASGKSLDECIRETEEEIAAKLEHLEALRGKRKKTISEKVITQFTTNGRAS